MNIRMLAVVTVLILAGIFLLPNVSQILSRSSENPTELVLQDARTKNPGSEVILKDSMVNGSDTVVELYLITHKRTDCPERVLLTYRYPSNHFTPLVTEITTGCSICKGERCIIAFPEEAVIASHRFNPQVKAFITRSTNPVPTVEPVEDGFRVKWTNELKESITVVVSSSAEVRVE